jgi:hypothetical protein
MFAKRRETAKTTSGKRAGHRGFLSLSAVCGAAAFSLELEMRSISILHCGTQ